MLGKQADECMSTRVKEPQQIEEKRGLTISIGLYKVQGHKSFANDTSMMSAGDKFLANVTSFIEIDCIQSCKVVLQWYSLP